MPIAIVLQSRVVETVRRYREFDREGEPGSGWSFELDAEDQPILTHQAGRDNYQKCLDGTYPVVDKGIVEYRSSYREPAIGQCDCGRLVALESFTNECACGDLFNWVGQRLKPRDQWEDADRDGPDYDPEEIRV